MQVTFTILLAFLHFGAHLNRSSEGVKNKKTGTYVRNLVTAILFFIRSRQPMGYRFMLVISLLTYLSVNVNAQTSQTFNTAGNHSFTPPPGVTNVTVECWGGGGCSGNNTGYLARGGGGGGAYTSGNISVVPGVAINVVVGAGGIYSDNYTTTDNGGQSSVGQIVAKGGSRGIIDNNVAVNGGAGGTVSSNPGGVAAFVSFPGGKGGNGYVDDDNGGGGGGGESASASGTGNPGGNGTKGAGGAGGSGNAGGGNGGRGANNDGSANSTDGNTSGGGGGGRADDNGNNTNGGNGQIIISWTIPVGYCAGNAIDVINSANRSATKAPDGIGFPLNETGDQLTLQLTSGNMLTAGGSVNVTWQRVSRDNSLISVEISEDGIAWTFADDYTNINPRNTWITQSIPLSINTQYIRFTSNNGWNLDIDAISYFTPCGPVCIPPSTFTVTGSGNYCTGGAGLPVALSGSETGVEYQLFNGIAPVGALVTGTGAAIKFGNQTTAGTYTVVAKRIADACPAQMNGAATITIGTIPSIPSPITGFTSPCIGTAQTYSVTNVAGVTYNWTFPADWTPSGGGTTNSVVVTPGASSGTVSVTASNTCGTSAARTLNVSVLTASISANYCYGGGNIELTANGGAAGDTYLWSTAQTSKQILVNIAGQYSVTIKNSAGCTATASYSVATELVVDGSFTNFNAAAPSFYTDYDQNQGFISAVNTGLGPEGRYAVNTSAWSNYPGTPGGYHSNFHGRDHTNNSFGPRNFMLVNGSDIKIGTPPRLRIIWQQTVAILPNTEYYFSAWGMNLNPSSPAQLQFEIVTVQNGTQQVGSIADLNIAAKPANEGAVALSNWVSFYSNPTWKSPIGATTATIRIINNNTTANGNDFGLDDISFATLAPMPAVIAPASNASTFCAGQALNLYANLTGGKAPFTYSWTGPDGFTSNIANPTIPSVTVANTGVYNLTITDGYGCPAVTASTSPITVNPSPVCSITGPVTLCPSSTGNTYTAPAGAAIYAWSITGNGTIQGLTNGESVTVTAGAANNSSFTLSLALAGSNGCISNCQQVISVEDNVAPTFVVPVLTSQCVEYVSQALYNPGQENTPLDITYIRPDYYLVAAGSTMLNLSSVTDNCALAVNPIAWTIDFGNNGSIEFSGAGQISTYGLDIQFPLGTNRITYTVTDLVGNVRVQFADLIVTPRPIISNNF